MLQDVKLDIKITLAGLWTSVMFLYIYADYFGLYQPGVLSKMLGGTMPPFGPVTQSVLLGTGSMLIVPSLMTALCLMLPAALNRWLNIIVAVLYIAIMGLTMPGSWSYYLLYGAVEILLKACIVWTAWRWPKLSKA